MGPRISCTGRSMAKTEGRSTSEPVRYSFSINQIGEMYFFTSLWIFFGFFGPPVVFFADDQPILFRIGLGIVFAFGILVGIGAAPLSKVRVGAPRRMTGNTIDMSRSFWFKGRIDIRDAGEAAGKKPEWIEGSGRYNGCTGLAGLGCGVHPSAGLALFQRPRR